MEFGLFCGGYTPKSLRAIDADFEHTRLMSEVDLAVVADQNNWKYWWTTEHHFLDEYSHISASESLLAFVAARTERIHLGSGIFNITPPVNHPARIAERVAMLDHLSAGRFEFGSGRGSSTTEQRGFGIEDPDLTKDMYDEVIGQFKHMWADEPFSFEGKYWSMPERNILPKPWVKPHPPMWVAAGNPGTFEKAAQMGLGVLCFTAARPTDLAPLIEVYKKTIANAEPVGEFVNDTVAVVSQFMCLEDREEAIGWLANGGTGYQNSLLFRYLDTFPRPKGVPEWPTVLPEPTPEQIQQRMESGYSCVGTPDDCIEVMKRYEEIGADVVLMGPSTSTWPKDVVEKSTKLFGQHVIPHFDDDPNETRTDRFRKG